MPDMEPYEKGVSILGCKVFEGKMGGGIVVVTSSRADKKGGAHERAIVFFCSM